MRLTAAFAILGLLALTGCASPPNTAATPGSTATADAQDPTAAAVRKPKHCITGTRTCSAEQEYDPAVGSMSGQALSDALRGHQVGGQTTSP